MSLTISSIRITNFLCFRGEHEVELGEGVFALVAEREGDPSRSNYQGKTAFLRAIRFALTGDHPKRTEDGWVTDGESAGGVDIELSDGTFVSRARTRGGATKLEVVLRDPDERKLLDDVAQEVLDRLVGFSPDEQLATWWVEQKGADAFVNGEPGELTQTVSEWCGLGPLRAAAAGAAEDLRELAAQRDRRVAERDAAERERAKLLERYECTAEEIDLEVARLKGVVAELEILVAASNDHAAADAQRKRAEANLAERTALGLRGHALEEELARKKVDPAELATAKAALESMVGKLSEAQRDTREKRRLAVGKFSGVCPVGGIECPATDLLNSRADENRKLLEAAEAKESSRAADVAGHRVHVTDLERIEREASSLEHQIKAARERLERLRSEEFPMPIATSGAVDDSVPERAQRERAALAFIERDRDYMLRQAEAARAASEAAAALSPRITALREAALVLGPSGAQRRLAEGFLATVEAGALRFLAASGIDLRVRFSWQRPLEGLADACSSCGHPFPKSRKVRTCESCGAERGPKIEQKLRCQVDPKSGGADDLAGLACRFSTAAWLKARRGSSWGVACLDEPLAAVDAHGRQGVARQLLSMLSTGYGFDQVFVSAHDAASVLGGMPRRVRIVGSERGSRIEVI